MTDAVKALITEARALARGIKRADREMSFESEAWIYDNSAAFGANLSALANALKSAERRASEAEAQVVAYIAAVMSLADEWEGAAKYNATLEEAKTIQFFAAQLRRALTGTDTGETRA